MERTWGADWELQTQSISDSGNRYSLGGSRYSSTARRLRPRASIRTAPATYQIPHHYTDEARRCEPEQ